MPKLLSITDKQELIKDSKNSLKWEVLDSVDRKIVMAVCFDTSPEIARKNLKMSIGGFYKRWKYLKYVYNNLIDELPLQAFSILKAYSKKAAEILGESLESTNTTDKIKAANSILDRVKQDPNDRQKGNYRKLTLEEFINS